MILDSSASRRGDNRRPQARRLHKVAAPSGRTAEACMNEETPIMTTHLDPRLVQTRTESGELERPRLFRRRIDCAGNAEVTDRRTSRGGGRRGSDTPME